MSQSRQREWLTDIFESAPSLVFLALWRSGADLETAGWTGAALAAMVLVGFRTCSVRFNPILLGINIHLLVITPLIVTMYQLGAPETGETLARHSHRGALVTIFLVGIALTLMSRRGFIGLDAPSRSTVSIYSVALLIASLTAIAWTFIYSGGAVPGIVLPIVVLFGLRRLLIARWLDSNGPTNGIVAAAGGATFACGAAGDASS